MFDKFISWIGLITRPEINFRANISIPLKWNEILIIRVCNRVEYKLLVGARRQKACGETQSLIMPCPYDGVKIIENLCKKLFSPLKRTLAISRGINSPAGGWEKRKLSGKFLAKRVFAFILFTLLGLIIPIGVHAISTPPQTNNLSALSDTTSKSQQGRTLYEAGQYSEAAVIWKQTADALAAKGDKLGQALALSNLSLTYQQLGEWQQAEDAIAQSLTLLKNLDRNRSNVKQILAQSLNIQGRLQLSLGQTEQALSTWQQAADTYKQIGDNEGVIRSQINQAQALQVLGLYNKALKILTAVNEALKAQPDSLVKATSLRSLGNALRVVGNLEQSQNILQQSLAIAQQFQSTSEISQAFFSLGNTVRAAYNQALELYKTTENSLNLDLAFAEAEKAANFYQQAATTSPATNTKVQAQLNYLSLLLEIEPFISISEDYQNWQPKVQSAIAQLPDIQAQIAALPPSRTTVYAQINLAQSLSKSLAFNQNNTKKVEIANLLARAIQQAKTLKDQKAESYALGNLGALYEQNEQFKNSQQMTEEALLLAQEIKAAEIAYRWQWQLGRLYKAQGDNTSAIASYKQAFNTLKSLRSDLVAVNPEVQFSFRDSVEPVYRQFVDILLEGGTTTTENLTQARDVIEALQLAELDNFFRDACINAKPVNIDQVDATAAVVYSIILKDRIEVILSAPKQPLHQYTTKIPQTEVELTLRQLRDSLQSSTASKDPELEANSQKIYNWLIRPMEADLTKSKAQTLVFVLDGSLRNIPMAVLNDGKQYLVEKYSIALTPGLQLLTPQSLAQIQLTALAAGLSETPPNVSATDFSPLPNVQDELRIIQSEVPGEQLFNQTFTSTAIQTEIQASPFPVVHIATHGTFSSSAENTFILTWDGRVKVKELDRVLRTGELRRQGPLELLVLSACETAQGDSRAALGLAGVAVRAGARSTLATLWQVSDASTPSLIGQFYKELADSKVTKAEALRRAQLSLLKSSNYQYPYYWAPFVLVGNWL